MPPIVDFITSNTQWAIDLITSIPLSATQVEWTTGFGYLYLYPIFSSIFAGLIFWYIFSYQPDKRRKKNFGVGVLNDLLILNNQLFGYFSSLLKHSDRCPQLFQNKLHGCSLTAEDVGLALYNKVISPAYLNDPLIANQMVIVGNSLIKQVFEIDVVINRLYSFNYFLNSEEVTLLRSMHEKIHRYIPYIQMNLGRNDLTPINPSISFMTESLMELQDDFRIFRKSIFKNKLQVRDFILNKIRMLFNTGNYKACIKECKDSIERLPCESCLSNLFIIKSYFSLNKKKIAYKLFERFLLTNVDLMGNRRDLYPLLSDQTIVDLVLATSGVEILNRIKEMVRVEDSNVNKALSENRKLKTYFEQKS